MHGTADPVYSVANAEDEMKLFVNSPGAELRVVEGGWHFLSASNPDDVNTATVEFINRWSSGSHGLVVAVSADRILPEGTHRGPDELAGLA
jgi:hypothetical protein